MFKEGDRVRLVKDVKDFKKGSVGTIDTYLDSCTYLIEFEYYRNSDTSLNMVCVDIDDIKLEEDILVNSEKPSLLQLKP